MCIDLPSLAFHIQSYKFSPENLHLFKLRNRTFCIFVKTPKIMGEYRYEFTSQYLMLLTFYRQLNVRQLGSLRPWDHRGKCYMDQKRIQCLSNAS